MNREMRIATVLMVLAIVFTLVGSSFAYWVYRANITEVSFTVTKAFECSGDAGGTISSNQLAPASCTNSKYAIQREVTVDPVIYFSGVSVYMDLWLNVDSVDPGLAASSNFKYALTRSSTSCTTDVISSGNFKGKSKVNILSDEPFSYRLGLTSQPNLSTTYYLYVWLDTAETDPATQNNNFSLSLGGSCTQGEYVGGEALTGAEMLINKANDATVTTYSSGTTTEMYTFSQPETTQVPATTDYRYIGSNPNNYITFNNETWRIIGVFDDKIKIIKGEPIENRDDRYILMSWDYKKSEVGSSTSDYGSNDWTESQIMYMLNPSDISTNVALKTEYSYDGTYVYDANDKIIYQQGCQPAQTDGSSYTCTANNWNLNETALSQVTDVTYYLGGYPTTENLSAIDYYTFERGEASYNGIRSINWTGKVGLMYPSDYAYTFAYGIDDTCYSNPDNCSSGIPTSSWFYNSLDNPSPFHVIWSINHDTQTATHVFIIRSNSNFSQSGAYVTAAIRPVVYLKSNIKLSGTGTIDDKYVIVS